MSCELYPEIPHEFPAIDDSFVSKDIISSFELCNGVEVTKEDVPPEVKIVGKKKYFLNAMEHLTGKIKGAFILVKLDGERDETVIFMDGRIWTLMNVL